MVIYSEFYIFDFHRRAIYIFKELEISVMIIVMFLYIIFQEGPMAHAGSIIAAGLGKGRVRLPCRKKRISVCLFVLIISIKATDHKFCKNYSDKYILLLMYFNTL